MNAVFDIVIVALLILCAAFGLKNGFVKTVMNFFSFIIAFFTAKILAPQLSNYLYNNYIKPNFAAVATKQIEGFLSKNVNLDALANGANPPDSFINMLKGYGFGLPDIRGWLNEAASKSAEGLKEFVATNLVEPLAKNISYFLAFILILIGAIILLKIITHIIDSVVKLPGLNFINRMGGLILGLFYGVSLSYIFVYLAELALPYFVANSTLNSAAEIINDTIFFKWFYEHSPIEYIMSLF